MCAPWWYDEAHDRRALALVFSMPSNAPSVVSRQSSVRRIQSLRLQVV